MFADRNLTVRQSAVIGKNKNVLRCQLEREHGKLVTAIRFKLDGQEIPDVGRKISMVYYPDINEYNGITDYEIEYELTADHNGIETFNKILAAAGLHYEENCPSKIARAMSQL